MEKILKLHFKTIVMRQILFRGYNLKNNKWLYGYYLVNRGLHFICPEGIQNPLASWEDFVVEEESVGEWTGLKDKNGKEIWEGDIVGFPISLFYELDDDDDEFVTAKISFIYGSFAVIYRGGIEKIFLQDLCDEIEVVGNTYQNKEILK